MNHICVLIIFLLSLQACSNLKEKQLHTVEDEPVFVESSEPLFMLLDENSHEYKEMLELVKNTLPEFTNQLSLIGDTVFTCVKILVEKEDLKLHLWLQNVSYSDDMKMYEAMVFETPPELPEFKPGKWLQFNSERITDWYILTDSGEMTGGYSLRLMRSKLPATRYAEFDQFIGVTKYK